MTALNQTIVDERRITVPIPCGVVDFTQLAQWINEGVQAGYTIAGAETLSGGHQRDPYTTGLRLVLKKAS